MQVQVQYTGHGAMNFERATHRCHSCCPVGTGSDNGPTSLSFPGISTVDQPTIFSSILRRSTFSRWFFFSFFFFRRFVRVLGGRDRRLSDFTTFFFNTFFSDLLSRPLLCVFTTFISKFILNLFIRLFIPRTDC